MRRFRVELCELFLLMSIPLGAARFAMVFAGVAPPSWYQAIAHIYIGLLIRGWWCDRSRREEFWVATVLIFGVEVPAFILSKLL